jgi:hypothetical protein
MANQSIRDISGLADQDPSEKIHRTPINTQANRNRIHRTSSSISKRPARHTRRRISSTITIANRIQPCQHRPHQQAAQASPHSNESMRQANRIGASNSFIDYS